MRMVSIFVLAACDTAVTAGALLPGAGEPCDESGCRDALICSHEAICAEAGSFGTAVAGDDCSDTEECSVTLECSSDNVCADPGAAGTGSSGDACSSDADCQAGFECTDKACVDLEIPVWEGGACPADTPDGEFRVLFQIPDLPTSAELDFYSMPFPNDLRLDTSGRPVMDGFPSPGDAAPAVDGLLGLLGVQYGWGTDPVVYFRFNRAQDLASIKVLEDGANVHFASIDPGASDYGKLSSFQFFSRTSRGRYICPNWLAVTTTDGRPLSPNRRYAVWIEKGITDADGGEAFRDDDFVTLMQDDRPTDVTDAKAYDQFGPFRDFVDSEGLTRGDIVAATVFSTGDPLSWVRYFRETADDETNVVSVGEAAPCASSPCNLSCSNAANVTEMHALLTLPDYTDADGDVAYTGTFRPVPQGTETTCLVLGYPAGDPPESGWPVALYLGDIGGTSQDAFSAGLATALANEGVATASIALPHHGDRATQTDSLIAWFDTEKPATWRGNMLQSLGDAHAVLRVLRSTAALELNPDETWVVGQGAGAETAVPLLSFDNDLLGGVLGNPAGRLGYTASARVEPYNLAHALQKSLADSNLGRTHPLIALQQSFVGPVDPVTTAEAVLREPQSTPKHLLVIQGVGETQFPVESTSAFLRAVSVPTAGEILLDFGQATIDLPTFENVSTDFGRRTAVSLQFSDGHDALFTAALQRSARFVGSGTAELSPTLDD